MSATIWYSESSYAAVHSIISFPVSYDCGTWFLVVREDNMLGVFTSRRLWKIFGIKMENVTGGWRKLHTEELHERY